MRMEIFIFRAFPVNVLARRVIVKEYKVCCDFVLGIGYNVKLGLELVQSQILKRFSPTCLYIYSCMDIDIIGDLP